MMLILLCLIAACLAIATWTVRDAWLRWFARLAILAAIAYVLFIYTGGIARSVLQPGPPVGSGADGFYFGIQALQGELLDAYLAAFVLAALGMVGVCGQDSRKDEN
jgi:hypothetical protein